MNRDNDGWLVIPAILLFVTLLGALAKDGAGSIGPAICFAAVMWSIGQMEKKP